MKDIVFKSLTVGLLAICAVVGTVIAYHMARGRQQANLQAQRECAEAGKAALPELSDGWVPTSIHRAHYNSKLNKCFVEIHTPLTDVSGHFKETKWGLYDAYDHKQYASYWYAIDNDGHSLDCWITPPSSEELPCNSEQEYKAFVAQYME